LNLKGQNMPCLRHIVWLCVFLLLTPLLLPAQVQASTANNQPWIHVAGVCPRGTVLSISSEVCSGSAANFEFTNTRMYRPTIVRDTASSAAPCGSVANGQTCYRMWYVGNDAGLRRRIGYAVSADGRVWERIQGSGQKGSVLDESNISGRVDSFGASSATVIKDGSTYKMWYTGIINGNNIGGIGYATSSDGLNWTRVNGPLSNHAVLNASGLANTFDRDEVVAPLVIRDQASSALPCEGGRSSGVCYRMWYEGVEHARNIFSLGYALSPDGLNWTRVAGPEDGGSIIWRGPTGSFDDNSLGVNSVIKDGDLFRMWYEAKSTDPINNRIFSIGSLVSNDGINWVRPNPNVPVFDGSMDPGSFSPDDVWAPVVIKENLRYRMWYSVSTNANSLGIGLAEMTPGTPLATPTLTRSGPNYTLTFSTNTAIPSNSQVLITPPESLNLEDITLGSISGFGSGASIRIDPAAISDASSGNTTRGALIISVPNGAGVGSKTINFSLSTPISSPQLLTLQTYGAREVLEYSQIDLDQASILADLAVNINNQPSSIAPGMNIGYEIVVSNPSAQDVLGASLIHTPASALQNITWVCTASVGSSCANASGSGAINQSFNIVAGGQVSFTIDALVHSNASGTLNHSANISVPSDITDTVPSNNSAIATTQLNPSSDIQLYLNPITALIPGEAVEFVLEVSNVGPSDVEQAQVQVTLPSVMSGISWTCQATGDASCAANGSTTINTLVDLASQSQVVFTINGTIASNAIGDISFNASVTEPVGVTDPYPSNNSINNTYTLAPQADLSVQFLSLITQATPGEDVEYVLEIQNNGPSDVVQAQLQTTLPSELNNVSWTCQATGNATCPASSNGLPSLLDLASQSKLVFTITGTISSSATGTLALDASISPPAGTNDPDSSNNSVSHSHSLTPASDIQVRFINAATQATAGSPITYSLEISNLGPSDASAIELQHTISSSLKNITWQCSATGNSSCPSSELNSIQQLTLEAGHSAIFQISGTIDQFAQGVLLLQSTASHANDTVLANNSSQHQTQVRAQGELSVSITPSTLNVKSGESISYSIRIENSGPSGVQGLKLTHPVAQQISQRTFTCSASTGSQCPNNNLEQIRIAAGGYIELHVKGTVLGNPQSFANVATLLIPEEFSEVNSGNNQATLTINIVAQAQTQWHSYLPFLRKP
jgi:uncharacterized repeat protein (TIGR01451 family)